MSYPAAPTPSSEIIHLVGTFTDTLDALPPSLTRSLSDLKELDAVLSGSLANITAKLETLLEMMHSPAAHTHTPFARLKLLREVTEDARVFRLGGEDKIRVATGTCETIATHTSHLSTLSTLLLTFLPAHLLPMLPPPSAPHGYPSSITPSSALARRQIFDYPVANHAGSGSTTRMQGALGLVREHWDVTRGRERPNGLGKRKSNISVPIGGGEREAAMHQQHLQQQRIMQQQQQQHQQQQQKEQEHRHPNQHSNPSTKKKPALPHQQQPHGPSPPLHQLPHTSLPPSSSLYAIPPHSTSGSMMNSSLDKEKRRLVEARDQAQSIGLASHPLGRNPSGNGGYSGMASAAEYELATNGGAGGATGSGGARTQKRKTGAGAMIDDGNGGTKRRKKLDISPEMTSRQLPLDPPSLSYSTSTTSIAPKPIRRTNISTTATTTSKVEEELSPEVGVGLVLMEDEEGLGEGEDDVDGQTYCYCHRVSFGEMIGCDGNECDREWFHLACVGLLSIPKGRWFCEECRRKASDKTKKRR